MLRRRRMYLAVIFAGLAIGCGPGDTDDGPDQESEQTGMSIAVDVAGDTDVAGFEFNIRECDGEQPVAEATGELEEVLDSEAGGASGLTATQQGGSYHTARHFQLLDAGCYDLEARPLDASGAHSENCQPAEATEVMVVDGKTTDLTLVSQCDGETTGAADAIAALNHPPQIESIDYEPSKFVHECEAVDICVTAFDPDGDPMEFEFEQIDGQQLRFDLEVTEPEVDGNRATSCMRAVPVWNDDYEFRVTVYDKTYEDGEPVRVEDAYGTKSHAMHTFPMYSNWDIELECYDPETELFHSFEGVRSINRIEGCIPIWPEQFYCSEFHWDETDRTCPDGQFKPETVYPLCEDHPEDSYDSEGRQLGEDRW